MRKLRTFLACCDRGRDWLIEETWCETCGASDLGLNDAAEREEQGVRHIVGACAVCGTEVRCVVVEIERAA